MTISIFFFLALGVLTISVFSGKEGTAILSLFVSAALGLMIIFH